MNISYRFINGANQEMRLIRKFYSVFLTIALLITLNAVPPVSAQRPEAADLSLKVAPVSVAGGATVQIGADIKANQKINVGMLIYRLKGPGGNTRYLEPIIIRNLESGNSYQTNTGHQTSNNPGAWTVEAYLCIGQCAIKGQEPPQNAAVTAAADFTVTNEPAPGPLNFP